jgi:hypothetical protein
MYTISSNPDSYYMFILIKFIELIMFVIYCIIILHIIKVIIIA